MGMAILDISKTLYEFWYDCMKPKYGDRAKLCYTDTDSFFIYIITKDYFKDTAGDVKRLFDTSNYDENDKRPLPIDEKKKKLGFFKDELGGKIMVEICVLASKMYSYKMDYGSKKKKAKRTKKALIKRNLRFEDYKDWLFNNKIIRKSHLRFKCDRHEVYTEEFNKVALRNKDNNRLQTFDGVTTYPHGTPVAVVYESEMMVVGDVFVDKHIDCPFYGEIVLKR